MPGHEDVGRGQWLQGFLDGKEIPRKAICEKIGLDQATFSKKINGIKSFAFEEAVIIGFAAGLVAAKQAQYEKESA